MISTTRLKIEIIKAIFSYLVIVSPPPTIGRDEPNNTSSTLNLLYYKAPYIVNVSQKIYLFLKEPPLRVVAL